MAPLKIQVTGNHSITLAAERAILNLYVSSTDSVQAKASQTITTTCNRLQNLLNSLSPKTLSGDTQPDAPVTKWTMSSLNTGSFVYHDTKPPQRTYSASTHFEVTFRDFGKLGAVVTEMAEMTGVEVRNVQWVLTEETKVRYAKVARQGAVRDAMDKARDYAAAAGRGTATIMEIMEDSVGGLFGAAAPTGIGFGASTTPFSSGGMLTRGGGAPQEQRLKFEPENRDVTCQVRAGFEAV